MAVYQAAGQAEGERGRPGEPGPPGSAPGGPAEPTEPGMFRLFLIKHPLIQCVLEFDILSAINTFTGPYILNAQCFAIL